MSVHNTNQDLVPIPTKVSTRLLECRYIKSNETVQHLQIPWYFFTLVCRVIVSWPSFSIGCLYKLILNL